MSASLRADRDYLRTVAYADDRWLTDRVSLYEHQEPRIDLVAEVLARLGPVEGRLVADVGCGNGAYVAPLVERGAVVVAADLSAGMLSAATARAGLVAESARAAGTPVAGSAHVVVADASALPMATASMDAALAMHMLYHVPEPARAVDELLRVLRPGGRLVAAVGGPRHLAESNELWVPLLSDAGLDEGLQDLGLVNTRLPVPRLQDLLETVFTAVELTLLASQVVLRDPAPLVRHAASTTAARVAGPVAEGMLCRLGESVSDVIRRDGEMRVTTEVALFVASAP